MSQQLSSALLLSFFGVLVVPVRAQQLDTLQLSTNFYSVAESSGSVTIQLRRSGPMTDYASVQVHTVTNTADEYDFEILSRTVTFAPGESNLTVSIEIFNDALAETIHSPFPPFPPFPPAETHEFFEVVLSDPDPFCCQLGPIARASIEIRDNDPGVQFGASYYVFDENAGEVQIDVSRLGDMTNAAGSVSFEIEERTARRGVDFTIATNRVSFSAGQTNATIAIRILNDAVAGSGKNFTLRFEESPDLSCCSVGYPRTADIWINDNDIGVEFASYSHEVREDASEVQITLQRSGDLITEGGYVTLQLFTNPWWSAEFTAIPNVDFGASTDPFSVFFSAGETNVTFSFPLLNDSLVENSEQLGVLLLNDQFGLPLGFQTNTYVSILDNDLGVEFVQNFSEITEPGGDLAISVHRIGDATNEFSVEVEVAGTATVGEDFILSTNRLFVPSGQSNVVTLNISVLDDPLVEEPQEYIYLSLANPTSGVPLGRQSSCQIRLRDNEYAAPSPGFWLATNKVYAVENGTNAHLIVVRGGNSSSTLTIDFTTSGEAVVGQDFYPGSGTLIFQPFETVKEITLQPIDDCGAETNETTEIVLTNASAGATIFGPGQATLQIIDDDAPGSLDAFDPTLDWMTFADNSLYYASSTAIALQPDGKIIIGRNGVMARIGSDGNRDVAFAHGATVCGSSQGGVIRGGIILGSCAVGTIVLESDGDIVAGGLGSIIRLNSRGGRDSNFVFTALSYGFHGSIFPGSINQLLLQPDGKIVVFGSFDIVNGESLQSPLRLNTDSTIDRSFSSDGQLGEGTGGALLPDGKLLMTSWSSLARLHPDGSRDEEFPVVPTDGQILAIAVLPDQRALIGGQFSHINEEEHRALARLNANGTLDTNFNPVIALEDADELVSVQALTLSRDGNIFLAGSFLDGSTRVLKLDSEGRLIPRFNSGLEFKNAQGFSGSINSIIEEPNGELLVAGSFDNVSSIPRPGIARLKGERSHIQLSPPQLSGDGSLRIVAGSQIGGTYVLQCSSNLTSWINVSTNTANDCAIAFDHTNLVPAAFYRISKFDP